MTTPREYGRKYDDRISGEGVVLRPAKRRGRPQIGEPGFEWQVGMWALRRDGQVVEVVGTKGRKQERACLWPVVVRFEDDLYSTDNNGFRWNWNHSPHDLMRIVAWPLERKAA